MFINSTISKARLRFCFALQLKKLDSPLQQLRLLLLLILRVIPLHSHINEIQFFVSD